MTSFDSGLGFLPPADRHEHDYFHFLIELTEAVITTRDIPSLAEKTASYLHAFFGLDFISLEIFDMPASRMIVHSIDFSRHNHLSYSCFSKAVPPDMPETPLKHREKLLFSHSTLVERAPRYPFIDELLKKGLKNLLHLPLQTTGKLLGALAVGSARHIRFTPDMMVLMDRISAQLVKVLDAILSNENSVIHHTRETADNIRIEPDGDDSPYSIIGASQVMQSILRQIEIVASSNATVLITGETGTGKGLLAQTIHNLSDRKNREMIKMNCTAIPSELMESELFGHEKGAFTGALNRRTGHFERADKSTLFLDEIGDMPIELQPKLLSVLQERQIRRLGGAAVIPVDIRFIAATNSDLIRKIEEKTFRSDLYYRLNVFPIMMPPLRERAEDIPMLAKFFIRKYAKQMNRHITSIPARTMELMTRLPWPGNIRELENVMERAVLLTSGSTILNLTPEALKNFTSQTLPAAAAVAPRPSAAPKTTGKNAIIEALKETGGQIGGKDGAAEKLGLKRTTLLARIKKLGIDISEFRKPE